MPRATGCVRIFIAIFFIQCHKRRDDGVLFSESENNREGDAALMNWLFTLVFSGLALSSDVPVMDRAANIVTGAAPAISREVGDETERFEQVYPFTANGRVGVSNENGSITVEAWDRNEIRLEYTKTADTKERLADVTVNIDAQAASFMVEAKYGEWKNRTDNDRRNKWSKLVVDFKLMVPRGAVLEEIETVNGSVSVSNFVNRTKISAVNGSVSAMNLRGSASLSTVNGEVVADFESLDPAGKVSLSTVNGSVRVVIPSDSSATLRADSLNGNITNDFGLTVRKGKYVGRDLNGRLGNGGAWVKLKSINGALAIARKNDGRNLSPVTNLLGQKGEDDDEFGHFSGAKMDAADRAAIRESQREVRKELEKIRPEIARVAAVASADAVAQARAVANMKDVQKEVQKAMAAQGALLANLGNADFMGGVPRIRKRVNSFPVKGVPKVNIWARGCAIIVRGWDKSEVSYQVTQFSDPRNSAPIGVNEEITETGVTLKFVNAAHQARQGNFYDDSRRMRVLINVPKKSNLNITSNGEIRLEGVTGDVELAGDDETINVLDSNGKLRITNTDGLVRIVGYRGDLFATTVDGDIFMEGDFSSINGKSVDGSFVLTVPESLSADVRASENNFTIEDLPNNKRIAKGHWRFGTGGREYTFVSQDGSVKIQNKDLIEFSK